MSIQNTDAAPARPAPPRDMAREFVIRRVTPQVDNELAAGLEVGRLIADAVKELTKIDFELDGDTRPGSVREGLRAQYRAARAEWEKHKDKTGDAPPSGPAKLDKLERRRLEVEARLSVLRDRQQAQADQGMQQRAAAEVEAEEASIRAAFEAQERAEREARFQAFRMEKLRERHPEAYGASTVTKLAPAQKGKGTAA